mmetsp:Transcript_122234/g.228266  ORF Transcript_122234/g.228266 Transcript_122234/m.228266 type:complete len:234 (-) Transcript_122234:2091-2792(-)
MFWTHPALDAWFTCALHGRGCIQTGRLPPIDKQSRLFRLANLVVSFHVWRIPATGLGTECADILLADVRSSTEASCSTPKDANCHCLHVSHASSPEDDSETPYQRFQREGCCRQLGLKRRTCHLRHEALNPSLGLSAAVRSAMEQLHSHLPRTMPCLVVAAWHPLPGRPRHDWWCASGGQSSEEHSGKRFLEGRIPHKIGSADMFQNDFEHKLETDDARSCSSCHRCHQHICC